MKKRYEIKMEVNIDVPDNATDKEIEDYIAFELGANGCLSSSNPIINDSGEFLDVTDFEIYELWNR